MSTTILTAEELTVGGAVEFLPSSRWWGAHFRRFTVVCLNNDDGCGYDEDDDDGNNEDDDGDDEDDDGDDEDDDGDDDGDNEDDDGGDDEDDGDDDNDDENYFISTSNPHD